MYFEMQGKLIIYKVGLSHTYIKQMQETLF